MMQDAKRYTDSISNSMHFSDPITYKTHFIPTYGLKDMNLARYKHFLKFQKNRELAGSFLTEGQKATTADEQDRAGLTGC
jgi:hypothetical protein